MVKSIYLYSTQLPGGTWQEVTDSQVYLNNENSWALDASWSVPIGFSKTQDTRYVSSFQISDINGDNLPDLVKSIYGQYQIRLSDGTTVYAGNPDGIESKIYLNNGHGWTLDPSWVAPLAFVDMRTSDGTVPSVQIADINGDGLADFLRSKYTESEVYMNNGNGWTLDSSWQIPIAFYNGNGSYQNQAFRIMDVNGDSLQDMVKSVYLYSTQLPDGTWQDVTDSQVYLNNGYGWTLDPSWTVPIGFSKTQDTRYASSFQISDINTDFRRPFNHHN